MIYRLGCRPDTADRRARAKSSRLLLGASPTVPSRASLEPFELPILDQGDTGSCTGHGSVQLTHVAALAHGGAVASLLGFAGSPDGLYKVTRAIERAAATPKGAALPKLTDGGAMPADVVTALARYGLAPMGALPDPTRYSDVTPATVNDDPDLDLLEQAGRKIVTGEYAIDERASDFARQMMAAMAGTSHVGAPSCPVGLAVFVDTAFMEWNPARGPLDTPPDQSDPNGGGHWIGATSYDTGPGGAIMIRGPNSWGLSWGDRGHFEVTPRWLAGALFGAYAWSIGGVQ